MNPNMNLSKTWFAFAISHLKKMLFACLFLLFISSSSLVHAQNSCIYEGKLKLEEVDGNLKISFEELPSFSCDENILLDSVKVRWYQQCNQWNDRYYLIAETGLFDTLTIPAEGWRAVWAETTWYSEDFQSLGSISDITPAVYYSSPEAPYLEENILPNPNDGNFEIEYKTNAIKQYVMIIGPYGIVYSRWHYGSCVVPIHLLSINPDGIYQVITKWYFEDECTDRVTTRQSFLVIH
jgi:hypothetical protein